MNQIKISSQQQWNEEGETDGHDDDNDVIDSLNAKNV